jgi:signal transduction histidine kinase/ActR/RegA family two-component response regulator
VDAGLITVMGARTREAPVRLGVSLAAALILAHSLGWPFTTGWFVTYLLAQGLERGCAWAHRARPGPLTRALALTALSVNCAIYGVIGLRFCAVMSSTGLGCCALLLGTLVLTTLRVTRASKAAFGASVWPLFAYAFAAPLATARSVALADLLNYETLALVLLGYSLITWRQTVRAQAEEQLVLKELDAARIAAETANAAKSEFLANMSHEIRTPLNGVLAMAQLMAKGDLHAPQREKLDVIRASGQDLLHVINDILDFSKIEAGKLELEVITFDTEQVLEGALAGFAAVAERKLIALQLEVSPTARGLRQGDPSRVRQILNNFVSNALKFTPEGGRVLIGIEGEGVEGHAGLTLSVKDSGVGIPPEKMASLFQKFTQVDASTTRRFGGTGLGLAICRELAVLMGGRVWADSEEGRGSTFYAALPLGYIGEAAASTSGDFEHFSEAPPLSSVRVLAAEDNPTNRTVLATIMDVFGFELTLTGDGEEAIAAWELQDFDLILMDVQMPVMDGVTATEAIRAAEARSGRPRTPIIALSANAFSHQVQEYRRAGMDAHVAKPIELAALQAAIEDVLAPSAGLDESLAA